MNETKYMALKVIILLALISNVMALVTAIPASGTPSTPLLVYAGSIAALVTVAVWGVNREEYRAGLNERQNSK